MKHNMNKFNKAFFREMFLGRKVKFDVNKFPDYFSKSEQQRVDT